MTVGSYEADEAGMLAGNRHVADAAGHIAEVKKVCDRFDSSWCGQEGVGDDLADQLGPACRDEEQAVRETLDAISGAYEALIGALGEHAKEVGSPQRDALDALHEAGNTGGAKR